MKTSENGNAALSGSRMSTRKQTVPAHPSYRLSGQSGCRAPRQNSSVNRKCAQQCARRRWAGSRVSLYSSRKT